MCIITTNIHASCGHGSFPSPLPCPIYTTYYSHHSVLDAPSALIPSASACPFVEIHDGYSMTSCSACTADANVSVDKHVRSGCASLVSSDSCSSIGSTASDLSTLKLLPASHFTRDSRRYLVCKRFTMERVANWNGWTKLNAWRKKIRRGGFGGQKVRRKMVRSSIEDPDMVV